MSSVMAPTSRNTTESSVGAAKQMIKLTHLDSKLREANLALTRSNAPTVKEIIKPTPFNVHFGDIASTMSSISESILRSMKTGRNHSVPMRTPSPINDCEQNQNFLAKCSQEFTRPQHNTRNSEPVRYHSNPKTSVVGNSKNSQLLKLRRRTPHWNLSSPKLDFLCKIIA